MADNSMDLDMDIDMSLENEEDPEIARLQAEAKAINARLQESTAADNDAMIGLEEAPEEGEVDSTAAVPTKVHIRGLDSMTTGHVKDFAAEHYSIDLFKRVEWIDDTSANLIYDTDIAAAEALAALSAEEVIEPLQSRRAKRSSTHPNSELEIRQAVVADVKQPGAKDRSRFYLFNPEFDPDTRAANGRKRRRYDERGQDGYKRRRNGENRTARRDSHDEKPFDVNFYDDDANTLATRKDPAETEPVRRRVGHNDDLFSRKQSGRLRDRSASPVNDGDGRFGFTEEQPYRRTARRRTNTPPRARNIPDNRGARDGLRKELFPDRKMSDSIYEQQGNEASALASNATKELFPDKSGTVHRRSDAQDLHPDDVADIIGKYSLDGTVEIDTYGRPGGDRETSGAPKRDLFSRINGGPKTTSNHGRLNKGEDDGPGFSIRGAGRDQDNSAGFSILGASKARVENPLVKELFPLKAGNGNAKKDLFDGRIKGRAAQRRRAEDLF